MQTDDQLSTPRHVGFIVDGNRRWARQHNLPAYEGHLAGYQALKDVVLAAFDHGIRYVTLYVFSTENWKRSQDEVSHLMKMTLKAFRSDINELIKNQIQVRVIGSREGVADDILAAIADVEQKTAHFSRGTAIVCFNYGGHREIVDAVRKCLHDGLGEDEITEEVIRERLYAPDIPDVDMLVRTSGEQRISNFMLWRVAYSELLFLEKYWPELRPDDIEGIIKEYTKRNRRFGGN